MSEKASRMRDLIAAVAGPQHWYENRVRWLEKAAELAGVSYRQAKSLFYGEIIDPDHKASLRMKEAAGKYEAEQLAQQFEGLARSLHTKDADFHRPDIAALVSAARALRGLDRSGTDGETE